MTTTLQLAEIWDKRNAGKQREAYDAFLKFSLDQALPIEGSIAEKAQSFQEKTENSEVLFDFLLLEVSFLRGKLEFDLSNDKLNEIEGHAKENSLLLPAEFYLQKALNEYAATNDLKALENYTLAIEKSTNIKTSLIAQLNRILCLEVLNYKFDSYLDRFSSEFAVHRAQTWAQPLLSQWRALLARQAFIDSDLDTLSKMASKNDDDGQMAIQLALFSGNPMFSNEGFTKQKNLLIEKQIESGEHYLSNFDLRTIEGQLINEDLCEEVNLVEKVDRIYLWVWRWLSDPTSDRLERIKLQLADVLEQLPSQPLTFSNYQMLENALRWLGLFSGLGINDIQSLIKSSRRPQGDIPTHLQYEKQLLDGLFSLRDGNKIIFEDTVNSLMAFSCHKLPSFQLAGVVNALAGESSFATESPLRPLFDSLSEFRSWNSPLANGFLINVFNGKIKESSDYQVRSEIISQSFSRLISLLTHKPHCFKEEVLSRCFDIYHYDSEIHDPKIANFLSRANRFFGDSAHFFTRNEMVYCEINSASFDFFGANSHTTLILDSEISQILTPKYKGVSQSQKMNTRADSSSLLAEKWLTRVEISERLGVSKATANRRISDWVKKNWMVRRGVGKSSRYKVLPALEEHLRQVGELS